MPKDSQPDNKKARMRKCKNQTPITRENQNTIPTPKSNPSKTMTYSPWGIALLRNGGLRVPMAKAGMRRPDPKDPHGTQSNHKQHFPNNEISPVPELQGKAKLKKQKAKPTTEK